MGNYTNPNHPAGELHPQASGFMRGAMNVQKTGSKHGSLAQQAHRNWVADQQAQANSQTAPVVKTATNAA